MTTIKLKESKPQQEPTYSAGQWFKSRKYGLMVLCSPHVCTLAFAGIQEDYAFYYYDNTKWLPKESASLSELTSFFGLDLTPISVTISED